MTSTDKDLPLISVILPTYNEKENISDLISELVLYLSKYISSDFELLVIDDNSPDNTADEVRDHFSGDRRIKVIPRKEKPGLALSIKRGIEESRGSIICWMDCDFSMPPHKLVELIQKVESGYDIAVGSRFTKGGKDLRGLEESWLAALLSRMLNYFISFFLSNKFNDYTSGFVAAKSNIFKQLEIKGDYGEYFINFIYQAMRLSYKIAEVPYFCLPRRKGNSKTGVDLADYIIKGWKYIILTLRLRFRQR